MNERVGAAAVINRHFQDGETTCRQLSKRLPDKSTIFAAEATAITLALYYTADSLNALFEAVPETCIVEFLREAGFFYLIWCNLLTLTSPQTGQYDRNWVIV